MISARKASIASLGSNPCYDSARDPLSIGRLAVALGVRGQNSSRLSP